MRLKSFLLASVLNVLFAGYSYANVQQGLVGWWRMDEGTGTSTTADSSGNGNTGTLENSPAWATNCPRSGCLSFDGSSQYVSCGNNVALFEFSSANSFSVSLWAYPTNVNSSWQAAFQIGRNMGLGNYEGIWLSGGNVWDFGGTGGNLGTFTAVANQWVHIVAVQTGSVGRQIYINGVLNASDSNPGNANGGGLCGMGSWGSEYFAGKIDDVRIYNRALSSDEVLMLYQAGVQIKNAVIRNAHINQ